MFEYYLDGMTIIKSDLVGITEKLTRIKYHNSANVKQSIKRYNYKPFVYDKKTITGYNSYVVDMYGTKVIMCHSKVFDKLKNRIRKA